MKSVRPKLGTVKSDCLHLCSAPPCLCLVFKIRQGCGGEVQHSIAHVYVEDRMFWGSWHFSSPKCLASYLSWPSFRGSFLQVIS